MNRLTKKYDDNYNIHLSPYLKIINKLSQLEDIEDEIGIDLITLFKALKKDFYIKKYDTNYAILSEGYNLGSQYLFYSKYDKCFYIGGSSEYEDEHIEFYVKVKEYGKTWALTREELEQ